jgi:lipooligosaccharide transport system permease protein
MFLDRWPTAPLRNVLVLLAYAVAAYWAALALTRKRFAR